MARCHDNRKARLRRRRREQRRLERAFQGRLPKALVARAEASVNAWIEERFPGIGPLPSPSQAN
jgi:hypothetical protein